MLCFGSLRLMVWPLLRPWLAPGSCARVSLGLAPSPPGLTSALALAQSLGLAPPCRDKVRAPPATQPQVQCKTCGKTISKTGVDGHFTKVHGVERAVVLKWLAHKDGNLLHNRNKKMREAAGDYQRIEAIHGHFRSHLLLTRAMLSAEWGGGAPGEADDHAAGVLSPLQAAPAKPAHAQSPSAGAAPGAVDALVGVAARIEAALAPKDIEVPLPEVAPKGFVFQWFHPQAKLRCACPIPKEAQDFNRFEFDDFTKYLETHTKQKSPGTRSNTILNLRRFFYMLDIEEGDWDQVGVMCAIYQKDVLPEMKVAPMLDRRYGWSRDIDSALEHYCDHLQLVCSKKKPRCRPRWLGPTSVVLKGGGAETRPAVAQALGGPNKVDGGARDAAAAEGAVHHSLQDGGQCPEKAVRSC